MTRLRFDEEAQFRIAHWLAQWGVPIATLLAIGFLVLAMDRYR